MWPYGVDLVPPILAIICPYIATRRDLKERWMFSILFNTSWFIIFLYFKKLKNLNLRFHYSLWIKLPYFRSWHWKFLLFCAENNFYKRFVEGIFRRFHDVLLKGTMSLIKFCVMPRVRIEHSFIHHWLDQIVSDKPCKLPARYSLCR